MKTTIILLFLLSLFSFASAIPCTSDDYKGVYSQCENGLRDLLWRWNQPHTCEGALPDDVLGLPCDISCGEGYYLPLGARDCKTCDAGFFSVGGGRRITDWSPTSGWNTSFHFVTYCTDVNNVRLPASQCAGWAPFSTNLALSSGNLTDDQNSVLELTVLLIIPGKIHFTYKIDCEPRYDYLTFSINEMVVITNATNTNNQIVEFEQDIPNPGFYTFRWVYRKDFSVSQGQDAAFIHMLEVRGTDYANSQCTPCPVGTFNNQSGTEHCYPCRMNTYSNQLNASECSPCPASQYSFPGSTECTDRLDCTADDWEYYWTDCGSPGRRTKKYRWKTPMICDDTSFPLHADEVDQLCAPCNPGTYRDVNGDYQCHHCPEGEYSEAGENQCHTCGDGTAALKELNIANFNTWPAGFTTGCTGECGNSQGWRVGNDYVDSGSGYGRAVDVWMAVNVTLSAPGSLWFNFTLTCSAACSLTVTDVGYITKTYYSGNKRTDTIALEIDDEYGPTHTIRWMFHRSDPQLRSRNDRIVIHQIRVSPVVVGGASKCTNCSVGTVAVSGKSMCTICGPGQTSNNQNTQCVGCPANTWNNQNGSTCIPCGHGTFSAPGSTECTTDCTYTPLELSSVKYDLSALARTDEMYGPVFDNKNMQYFINICSKIHHNHTCYDQQGKAIESYICQNTVAGWGVDLGNTIGFYTLDQDPRNGLIVNFDHGTKCSTKNGIVERTANITFVCDPLAGVGQPEKPLTSEVEGPICNYHFYWRSIYGCPVCTSDDWASTFTDCRDGTQRQIFFWRRNPRHCHDGATLPSPKVFNCSTPNQVCPAGEFQAPNTNNCTSCPAGYFSVGGGNHISQWSNYSNTRPPEGMSLPGTSFLWLPDRLESLPGRSPNFLYTQTWISEGSLSFTYKLWDLGDNPRLEVWMDGTKMLSQSHYFTFQWAGLTIPRVSSGIHTFWFRFGSTTNSTGSSSNDFGSTISKFAIGSLTTMGTSKASRSCTPCPAGTFTNKTGSAFCNPCPENTFSSGGLSQCLSCQPGYYSVAGSSVCAERHACTLDDFQRVFLPCNRTTRNRKMYWTANQPAVCMGSETLRLLNDTVPCIDCPVGTFPQQSDFGNTDTPRSHDCGTCPNQGTYWNQASGSCQPTGAGKYVQHEEAFFMSESSDGFLAWKNRLIHNTKCSGGCGSPGWRYRGTYMDSGLHNFDINNDVDSFISLDVKMTIDGSVSFDLEEPTPHSQPDEARIDFYVGSKYHNLRSHMRSSRSTTIKIDLPAGPQRLTWNYHQPANVPRNLIRISNVRVVGTETGASFMTNCPKGTASAGASATKCEPCQPGYYANLPGQTQCQRCEEGKFSNKQGAAECTQCGRGTTSSDDRATCVTDCLWDVEDGDQKYTYSLQEFPSLTSIMLKDSTTFIFSLCSVLSGSECVAQSDHQTPLHTHICIKPRAMTTDGAVVPGQYGVDQGSFLSLLPNAKPDSRTGFKLIYTSDVLCEKEPGKMDYRTTYVNFICDVDVLDNGNPILVTNRSTTYNNNYCAAFFDWRTINACPVCTEEDYERTESVCTNGVRTSLEVRQTNCSGPATRSPAVSSCAAEVTFPVGAVIAGIVVFLIVLVVAIAIFIHNRRVTHKYNLLLNDASRSVEMDITEPSEARFSIDEDDSNQNKE